MYDLLVVADAAIWSWAFKTFNASDQINSTSWSIPSHFPISALSIGPSTMRAVFVFVLLTLLVCSNGIASAKSSAMVSALHSEAVEAPVSSDATRRRLRVPSWSMKSECWGWRSWRTAWRVFSRGSRVSSKSREAAEQSQRGQGVGEGDTLRKELKQAARVLRETCSEQQQGAAVLHPRNHRAIRGWCYSNLVDVKYNESDLAPRIILLVTLQTEKNSACNVFRHRYCTYFRARMDCDYSNATSERVRYDY